MCGQFLGCMVSLNEARYHLRRMWNKYGLEDMTVNNKGIFFFKFQDEQGILQVISNGPWMVNNKPLFVQRWGIDVCLDKTEPVKLPVWVKLLNVPLEAWSDKGISSLASCLGKPIIMDEVTTNVCKTGTGRLGFARVLIEINAEKQLKDVIEVAYRKKDASISMTKYVQVEYDWKPTRCSHCCVFGHDNVNCRMIPRDTESDKQSNVNCEGNDGFQKVTYRNGKNENYKSNNKRNEQNGISGFNKGNQYHSRMAGHGQNNNKQNYRPKRNVEVAIQPNMDNNSKIDKNNGNNGNTSKETVNSQKIDEVVVEKGHNKNEKGKSTDVSTSGGKKQNNVGIIGNNRYSVLDSLVEGEELRPNKE